MLVLLAASSLAFIVTSFLIPPRRGLRYAPVLCARFLMYRNVVLCIHEIVIIPTGALLPRRQSWPLWGVAMRIRNGRVA
jgi:hypothetical protein